MDVVEKRQTVLSKKIQLYCLATFQRFFGVLRLLTIAITLLLFSVLKIGVYSEWILLVSIYLLGLAFYKLVKNSLLKKGKKTSRKKKMFV
jgi:hypothetical protein